MKIHNIKGDLLKFPDDIDIICQSCNTENTMGAGIAAQIKKQIPEMWYADCEFDIPIGEQRLGNFSYDTFTRNGTELMGVNLYAQELNNNSSFGFPTCYHSLIGALYSFRNMLAHMKYSKFGIIYENVKIGFPKGMCSVLGGADWGIVMGIITQVFQDYDVDIYFVEFQ